MYNVKSANQLSNISYPSTSEYFENEVQQAVCTYSGGILTVFTVRTNSTTHLFVIRCILNPRKAASQLEHTHTSYSSVHSFVRSTALTRYLKAPKAIFSPYRPSFLSRSLTYPLALNCGRACVRACVRRRPLSLAWTSFFFHDRSRYLEVYVCFFVPVLYLGRAEIPTAAATKK